MDLSTFIAAIKPRERTPQYVILATLFALEAHSKPVTVKQVSETLQFELGQKAPVNIAQCLRSYSVYVKKHKGPPLHWSLTRKGVERLRALSGLTLSVPSDLDRFESDIGIVCALEHPELTAVLKTLGGEAAWTEAGDARHTHTYRETKMVLPNGTALRVLATTSTSMGLVSAAIATTQLIFQFRPRLVAMIGIAAGTHYGDKQFGDILVADPSVDYSSGKVVRSGDIREFQPDPYPIGLNPRLRIRLNKYGSSHPLLAQIRKKWGGRTPTAANRVQSGPWALPIRS